MKIPTLLAGLVFVVLALPVLGHHSTANIYDEEETVEVTGKVVQWHLVNPHPYLTIEIIGSDGRAEEWDLSFGGSAAAPLRRRGYTPDTFAVGEVIIARGNPPRDENLHGILLRGDITREDGSPVP